MNKYIQIDLSSFEDKLNEYISTLEKAKSIAEDLANVKVNLSFNCNGEREGEPTVLASIFTDPGND